DQHPATMKSNSDKVIIPCEFCQKPVKSYNLENHLTVCEKADENRRRRLSTTLGGQPGAAPNAEVTFRLQSGPMWDTVKMSAGDINFVSLHRRAYNFLCTRSPEHGLNRLNERLLLFLHDYERGNVLLPLTAASKVTEGTVLEVVVLGGRGPTRCNFECGTPGQGTKGEISIKKGVLSSLRLSGCIGPALDIVSTVDFRPASLGKMSS
ncbi:hypothetical protein HPB47_013191, partial [Ixodes persulcatus]